MKRPTKFLLTATASLLVAVVTPLHAAKRPDILFIFCDDLTNQALSCLGDSRKPGQTQGAGKVLNK